MCDKIEWEVHLTLWFDSKAAHVWSVVHGPDEAAEPRFDTDGLSHDSAPVRAFFELLSELDRFEVAGEQVAFPGLAGD